MAKILYPDNSGEFASLTAHFERLLRKSDRLQIAMALINRAGWKALAGAVRAFLARKGRLEILFGTDLPTDPSALTELLHLTEQYPRQAKVRLFCSEDSAFFHPKVFIFSRGTKVLGAIIGSSNLTHGGLVQNVEMNVQLEAASAAREARAEFESWFEGTMSGELTARWIAAYQRQYDKRMVIWRKWVAAGKTSTRQAKRVLAKEWGQIRIRGTRFVVTGKVFEYTRKGLAFQIRKHGGEFYDSPESLTPGTVLVKGMPSSRAQATKKLRAARAKGLLIVGAVAFLKKLHRSHPVRKR